MKETHEMPDRQPKSANASSSADQEPTVIFVSDSHFHLEPDPAEQVRLAQFIALLEYACQADHLVLLGDIFDFWFDYPHFRLSGYDNLLYALDRVKAAGTKIHFIGGNHDIWAANYFHHRYGCSGDGEAETLRLGSRRVHLSHGDGLLKFDWAYNSFRAIVRTRLGIVLAKSLHPEVLFGLSEWLSGKSRGATRDEASALEPLAKKWLEKQDQKSELPWDLLVMGHIHHGFVIQQGSHQMAALAGWFAPLSYGLLQNGQFQLLDFAQDSRPVL